MVATISPEPRLQFFASDGSFLVGGKLYTYAAGTTTPLATYTTSTGLIANTNPVILDSRGEASVWLTSSKYKFVLKTAADVEIWTQDQLQGYASADGTNAYGTWPIDITGNAATATIANSVVAGGAVNRIIAGTNITISPTSGVGDVTVNSTSSATVTSVAATGLYGFTVTGGPITTSGTLTVTPPAPSTAGNVLTSNGTAWVSQSFTGGSTTFGAVGAYVYAVATTATTYAGGDTISGSSLQPAGAVSQPTIPPPANVEGSGTVVSSSVLSGTWRCMGYSLYISANPTYGVTLWLRTV